MPQILYVNERDPKTGKNTQREISVRRSWSRAEGQQIFLLVNGVYAYKSGEPVVSDTEFDLIGDPVQRKLSQAWWDRIGRAMSEKYYAEKQAAIEAANLSGMPALAESGSNELDAVLYIRRPVKNRSRSAFSAPATWYDWFDVRPDWWGHAGVIELGEWRYESSDGEHVGEKEDEALRVSPSPQPSPLEGEGAETLASTTKKEQISATAGGKVTAAGGNKESF